MCCVRTGRRPRRSIATARSGGGPVPGTPVPPAGPRGDLGGGVAGPSVRVRGRGAVLQAPSGPGDAVGVGVGRGAGVHVSRGALAGAGRGVAAGGAGVLGGCDFTGGFVWADPLQGGFVWGPPRADWAEMGFGAPPKCPLAPSCPTPQGAVWRPPILFSPAGSTDYNSWDQSRASEHLITASSPVFFL